MNKTTRPEITFIPMSTDAKKIEFFGTLMPSLMLLAASPLRFLKASFAVWVTPKAEIDAFIMENTDDWSRQDDVLLFVHKWNSLTFDPITFANARTFLAQLSRLLKRSGYLAKSLSPLSPDLNLPKFALRAGLGNLSPYGLLVHPEFGPRVILSGMKTDYPLAPKPRLSSTGCDDCLACVIKCPQKPNKNGIINLSECQSCAQCLVVCPVGKKPNRNK